jgi:hypothetical protein
MGLAVLIPFMGLVVYHEQATLPQDMLWLEVDRHAAYYDDTGCYEVATFGRPEGREQEPWAIMYARCREGHWELHLWEMHSHRLHILIKRGDEYRYAVCVWQYYEYQGPTDWNVQATMLADSELEAAEFWEMARLWLHPLAELPQERDAVIKAWGEYAVDRGEMPRSHKGTTSPA